MLWGQILKVFTDNLTQDALDMTCDRVYYWCLLLEDYGPETVHLEGHKNVVADAISLLEFNDTHHTKPKHVNIHKNVMALAMLFHSY